MITLTTLTDSLDFIAARLDASSQIALIALTADARIIDYNSGFANLIERHENLKDIDLKSLLLPESSALLDSNLVARSPFQLNFALSDKDSIALQCAFQPTRNGYLMFGEQAILADSEIMRTMSMLNNELAGLTRELNRKNRALQQTQSKLQSKNAEIEEFASIVAHDFNGPLITISAFIDQIEQNLTLGNSDKIESDLAYIKGAAIRLGQLLTALRHITGVSRADNLPEKIRFADLIATCLTTLAGPLQQQGVDVNVMDTPLELMGDPLQLGQLWQNLIENAVKYMGDQPHPRIDVGIDEGAQPPVFFVRDNGIGIKPEHAERVFQLFAQLNRNNPGSGLGLALVKKIVERYQGKIWVESEGYGMGSCFRFTLPDAVITAGEKV